MGKGISYKDAGVDIDEGGRLVRLIKGPVRSSFRPGVMGDIGGFGAFFKAGFKGMKDPVLVSATDGVGTKLMVAFMADRHDTVGVDLVAMSVNDIVVSGAEPLFFLDYLATGRLDAARAASVVKGVVRGCREAGCALIGGETAEMPGLYRPGHYDLAGFCVGVVERRGIIDGRRIRPGDRLIGLASSGLHSNGFSLARKVLFEKMGLEVGSRPRGLRGELGSTLLRPTRIYVRPVLDLLKRFAVKGMAHITGGGFQENIPRMLPEGVRAVVDTGSWTVPAIFRLIAEGGGVDAGEMLRTFNCGVGMAAVVSPRDEAGVLERLKRLRLRAWTIGEIEAKKGKKGPAVVLAGSGPF